MDLELQQFKTEINLPELATHFGFEIDRRKTSKNCIVMKSPSNETFLFYKNRDNNHFLFVNASANSKPDSVIGFVQYNVPEFSLGNVRHFLRTQLNILPQTQKLSLQPSSKPNPRDFTFSPNITELTNYEYLHKRGIKTSIVNNELFKGTVFQCNISMGQGITYRNLAFPIHNFNKLVGYELKNSHFKGAMEHSMKSEGFWNSNIPPKPISALVVVESPLEALSHYQLHERTLKQNPPLYISSNGTPANNHFTLFHEYLSFYQPKKTILANNNDLAGLRFNINYLGSTPKELKAPVSFKLSITKNSYCNLRFTVYNPPSFNNDGLPDSHYQNIFTDKVSHLNAEASKLRFVKGYNKPFMLTSERIDSNSTQFIISFHNTRLNLKQIYPFCQDISPNKNFLDHIPVSKDFNQDLINNLKKNVSPGMKI